MEASSEWTIREPGGKLRIKMIRASGYESYTIYRIFRHTTPNLVYIDSNQIVHHLIDLDENMYTLS